MDLGSRSGRDFRPIDPGRSFCFDRLVSITHSIFTKETIMNARRTLSSLVVFLVSAGNVLAEEPSTVYQNFVSSKTRAEVQAELFAYKKAGVNPWSMSYNPLRHFKSLTTREAVVAEFVAVRAQASALYGEDGGATYLSRFGTYPFVAMLPGSTRVQVKSELSEAIRSGDILVGGELALRRNELYPGQYRSPNHGIAGQRPLRSAQQGSI
jgi:hypothetical protein